MKPLHVVVADDEPQVLRIFARQLSRAGYRVTPVDNGKEALQVVTSETVDLLVLDLDMPRPDGFELLKSLRKKRPGLRILVVSGYLQGALLTASEFLGATASLSKVDASRLLVPTVNTLLH